VYRLDFRNKHKGKTIQDIMTDDPSYLVEWALTDRAGDLLKKRPGLVKGLRELSNEYINTKPQLRRAMEAKEIYPSDQGTAFFIQGQDDQCRYMQATQWNSILEKNVGPEYELNDLYTIFEGFDDGAVVTFTGTIVRTEVILFDDFSDDLQETYTILPYGWPRNATIKGDFFTPNPDFDKDWYRHMLYKTYRVTGEFTSETPSAERFVTLKDPEPIEPASLRTGLCFKFTEPVLSYNHLVDDVACVRVLVQKQRNMEEEKIVEVWLRDIGRPITLKEMMRMWVTKTRNLEENQKMTLVGDYGGLHLPHTKGITGKRYYRLTKPP
jgi:hypothetical protein